MRKKIIKKIPAIEALERLDKEFPISSAQIIRQNHARIGVDLTYKFDDLLGLIGWNRDCLGYILRSTGNRDGYARYIPLPGNNFVREDSFDAAVRVLHKAKELVETEQGKAYLQKQNERPASTYKNELVARVIQVINEEKAQETGLGVDLAGDPNYIGPISALVKTQRTTPSWLTK